MYHYTSTSVHCTYMSKLRVQMRCQFIESKVIFFCQLNVAETARMEGVTSGGLEVERGKWEGVSRHMTSSYVLVFVLSPLRAKLLKR